MFKEFRQFILRGNVMDMAIGIIIGVAFGKIVTSLVQDVIMPPIGLLLGKVDFSNLFINLSGKSYPTLAAAKQAGAATVNYGLFANTVLDFLVIAFAVFMIVRWTNRLRRNQVETAVETQACPYCLSSIPLKATRCPQCTSQIESLSGAASTVSKT